MKQIDLLINDKALVIKKLPLRKYADLLAALEDVPKYYELFNGKTSEEILGTLPSIITTCYPDVVRILKVITDLPEEEIHEMGLDDVTQILVTFFEINNYSVVYDSLKKVTARPDKGQTPA